MFFQSLFTDLERGIFATSVKKERMNELRKNLHYVPGAMLRRNWTEQFLVSVFIKLESLWDCKAIIIGKLR